ncbi:MAG: nucleotidyltransferase family protein [Janthinobacterium lividum]
MRDNRRMTKRSLDSPENLPAAPMQPAAAALPSPSSLPTLPVGDAPVGVLLAAGFGRRFDASGTRSKLLAPLRRGDDAGVALALAAARRLCAALPRVVAVTRGDELLDALLADAGCAVIRSARAAMGMGASLADAVRATPTARGWVVALADMPFVSTSTIVAVATAIMPPAGATAIAAPARDGRRGHPVAFGRSHRAALLRLDGDSGPRQLLAEFPCTLIETLDEGVFIDVDTASDL